MRMQGPSLPGKGRVAAAVTALALMTGCATSTPVERDLSAFRAAAPRSILVVPAVNRSLDVDAPSYLLSALPVPLAERGYYVFPVHTVRTVLEQEGWYEAEQVRQQPTLALAKLFGADAVLYVTINRWDAQYAILSTTVTVDFSYQLVARDGTEIWKADKQMQYSPQAGNNSSSSPLAQLLAAALGAALTRAAPNYMPLTQQANREVFSNPATSIPNGPYRPTEAQGK